MCQSVALSKPYFCLFLNKNNCTLSILASDLGFQRLVFVVGQTLTAERAVWEDALSSCTIHFCSVKYYQAFLDEYLVLNIPKYELRMLDVLFRGVNVWLQIVI